MAAVQFLTERECLLVVWFVFFRRFFQFGQTFPDEVTFIIYCLWRRLPRQENTSELLQETKICHDGRGAIFERARMPFGCLICFISPLLPILTNVARWGIVCYLLSLEKTITTKINSKLHFKFYVTAALGNLNAGALRVMKFRPFCIQKGYLSTFYNTF